MYCVYWCIWFAQYLTWCVFGCHIYSLFFPIYVNNSCNICITHVEFPIHINVSSMDMHMNNVDNVPLYICPHVYLCTVHVRINDLVWFIMVLLSKAVLRYFYLCRGFLQLFVILNTAFTQLLIFRFLGLIRWTNNYKTFIFIVIHFIMMHAQI